MRICHTKKKVNPARYIPRAILVAFSLFRHKKAKTATKVETPVKQEPVKEEIAKEEKQSIPSLEETREAVKDVMAKAADKTQAKTEFKAFLDSIGAEKVTSATDEQRIQIMEWVASRG